MTAAAARKLQKEIENVLKKVDDGISEFDDYWEQATAASNGPQKERLGEELKKSINKLQRLRVQIREWIGQSAVQSSAKDKLEDSRKRIEHDMQRFKEFERDLKTKAFSTCALAKADELELEEAEKMKYQDWLASTIQQLNDQLDAFEADLELLGNKKSLSNDDKSRSSQLKTFQERHRWHVKKLELLLRAVDNDAIDMSDLAVIKESVELYVDSHQDQDYYHDEGLYDCFESLDLTAYEEQAPKPRSPTEALKEATCGTPVSSKEEPRKSKDKEKQRKEAKKDKKKEEKEKKAQAGGASNTNSAGGASTKAASSPQIIELNSKAPLLEKLDLDEVKVQEDQLLSEAEEFICKICQIHVVGCSPKLTSCSHLFCGDCIAQWFAQHPESQTWAQRAKAAGPERVVPCPVCKQPLNEKRDLYPVCGVTSRSENLLLWRMLSSLKIMCANHPKANPDGKCEWIGEYGSYQKHIRACKNQAGPVIEVTTPVAEAPVRLPSNVILAAQDSESEAGDSSCKDVSRLTTPAVTPAVTPSIAAAMPPAARVSPLPSPAHEPAAAPRVDVAMAAMPPSDMRSPCSATVVASQARSNPAPAPAPSIAEANRGSDARAAFTSPSSGLAMWASEQSSPKQAMSMPQVQEQPRGAAATSPATPAPQERPRTTPKAEPEVEPVIAPVVAPSKSPTASGHSNAGAASVPHESKTTSHTAGGSVAQRQFLAHETEHKESNSLGVVKAASSFEPTGSNMVAVQAGDRIQVLEQHSSGWTYCKNLSLGASSNAGWVPSWITQAPPSTGEPRPASQIKPKASSDASQSVDKVKPSPSGPASQPSHAAPVVQAAPVLVAPATQSVAVAPTPEARNVMRATSAFSAATASQLSLSLSDLVDIVERHPSGWTYGRKVCDSQAADSPVLEGWFPDWVVCPQK